MPYCFARSYVKLQGDMGKKNRKIFPNWAFPDCNLMTMAMELCKKLVVALRSPIVFQGHPSNFMVTWDKKIVNFDLH